MVVLVLPETEREKKEREREHIVKSTVQQAGQLSVQLTINIFSNKD